MPKQEIVTFSPQEGPQQMFHATSADIAIYGGSAGGGKTFSILLEPVRHINNPKFQAVIFRRESPMITNPGGLWDESSGMYPLMGAKSNVTMLRWIFPSKATIRFAHLEHEDDKNGWQGAQIPFIGFDELTHFTESQFFYLLSRNRSMSGVKPYVRATCNPDATSWVKKFIAPWVDKSYPLHAESGQLLWMVRNDGVITWYESKQEAIDANSHLLNYGVNPEHLIKSVTFIRSTVYDNKKLLEVNPEYLGNLLSLPYIERMRLLDGDWDVLPEAGKVFNREWFTVVDEAPEPTKENQVWDVRFWDFAASVKKSKGDDPDWTVGTLMRRHKDTYYVVDVQRFRKTPGDVKESVKTKGESDGVLVPIRWEEEGGASGKFASDDLTGHLAGYDARGIRPQGDKVARANPLARQAEIGNVKIVKAPWNESWLTELHHFPDMDHDDAVDSASGAFNYLARFAGDVGTGPDIWS